MSEQKTCPYCHTDLKKVWREDTFLKCPNCQLLVRNQVINTEGLDKLYQNSWSNPFKQVSETGGTTTDLADQYSLALTASIKKLNINGVKLLDFGAGRGAMSFALSRAGAEVTAVEPYGFEFLKKQGLTVYHDLEEIPEHTLFDGIVSIDVIEHLSNPWNHLQEIKKFLVPGGWVFISTANSESLNARISKSRWREALTDGHLTLFNSASLHKMVSDAGYQRIQRLNWNIAYSNKLFIRVKDFILRTLKLDGELRFLAYKEDI